MVVVEGIYSMERLQAQGDCGIVKKYKAYIYVDDTSTCSWSQGAEYVNTVTSTLMT